MPKPTILVVPLLHLGLGEPVVPRASHVTFQYTPAVGGRGGAAQGLELGLGEQRLLDQPDLLRQGLRSAPGSVVDVPASLSRLTHPATQHESDPP